MDQSEWKFDRSSRITSDEELLSEEDERSEEDQEPRNVSQRDDFYVRIDEEGSEDVEILAERVVAEEVATCRDSKFIPDVSISMKL